MGSLAQAVITGFICRLCSRQKRKVIHIYSKKGQSLQLLEKIKLLPITVEINDNLPKTICESCFKRLELQYDLVQKFRRNNSMRLNHKKYHSNGRCPVECPLHGLNDESWSDGSPSST